MSKLTMLLSVFAVSAFLALTIGLSQAQAGVGPSVAPYPADCGSVCPATETCPTLDSNDACNCPGGDDSSGPVPCHGTDGDDTICGSADGDEIFAGKGDDIICAGDGDDTIHGGYGCDDQKGEGGNDTIQGGHCADYFDGGDDTGDVCLGGWGNDVFTVAGSCETSDQGKDDDHKSQGECVSVGCGNVLAP